MSNCQPTISEGAIFETYGEYRQQKFCDNICSLNKDDKCLIEDASCSITFTTKNNGAGNISIYSNNIVIDCSDGSFNITSGETNPKTITFKDASINILREDLSFSTDDFNFDISNNISIDCSDNINFDSKNTIVNSINLDIFSNLLNINGISNIYIDTKSELNIDIDNSASITIQDKTFIFEKSANEIVIKDMSNIAVQKIYTISGEDGANACCIL